MKGLRTSILFVVFYLFISTDISFGGSDNKSESTSFSRIKKDIAIIEFAEELVYKKKDVDDWFNGKNRFAQYDSELGWLLLNAEINDGIDGSLCTYTYYDEGKGSRILINNSAKKHRISAYGDSFTQCHQVSDGQTWEEVLSAQIGEPIKNYGVGGWSVYQAYLRMLKEEKTNPSEFIIFNIYSDDHYRNLDAWRSIRVTRTKGGFGEVTLPYVEVDVKNDRIIEHQNPCPTKEDVYKLCDVDWVVERFKDDFIFNIMLSHRINATTSNSNQYEEIKKLATTFGINTRVDNAESINDIAQKMHIEASLFSTKKIVAKIEKWANTNNKKVLYVLSYNAHEVAKFINENERFDASFLKFMNDNSLPHVDLLEKHYLDYKTYRGNVKDYVSQYFIGHYNPKGNFFHAWSIKQEVENQFAINNYNE